MVTRMWAHAKNVKSCPAAEFKTRTGSSRAYAKHSVSRDTQCIIMIIKSDPIMGFISRLIMRLFKHVASINHANYCTRQLEFYCTPERSRFETVRLGADLF
jgi:hypothetical protein